MYQFPAAQQVSTSKLTALFEKLKKTVPAPRINESKVTMTNLFIDNIFALESGKASENDKTTPFRDWPQILGLSVNPQIQIATYIWSSEMFQFQQFSWKLPVAFRT